MRRMKWILIFAVLILLISSVLGITLFRVKHPNNFERMIISKIKQESSYLANFETMYSLAFTNFRDNLVFSDDFYIRYDQATVPYGYKLENATIRIKKERENKVLWVRLPQPKQLPIDREIISIESRRKDYKPIDSEKQPINVDTWMNDHLSKAIEQYEDKSIEMTKEMSRQYFEALAYRFGLELELEFTE